MGFFDSIGGALGAGLGLLNPVGFIANLGLGASSGAFDYFAAEKDRQANDDANRTNILESRANNAQAIAFAREQMAMAREFAQNGVRWRIEDAGRAGISPLAALGASGQGYSPSSYAFSSPNISASRPGDSMRALGNMGQNISRALMATATPFQRAEQALALKRGALENDLLEAQLANSRMELMMKTGPSQPAPTTQLMRTPNGQMILMPSNEFQAAAGGNIMSNAAWWLENKAIPFATGGRGQYPGSVKIEGEDYDFWPVGNRYIRRGGPIR